jgi:hypothetical protein
MSITSLFEEDHLHGNAPDKMADNPFTMEMILKMSVFYVIFNVR